MVEPKLYYEGHIEMTTYQTSLKNIVEFFLVVQLSSISYVDHEEVL